MNISIMHADFPSVINDQLQCCLIKLNTHVFSQFHNALQYQVITKLQFKFEQLVATNRDEWLTLE